MKPYHLRSTLFAAILLLAEMQTSGCSVIPVPPPEVASIVLTKMNSPRVTIREAWLEKKDPRLFLRGHVFRSHPGDDEDTSLTHLTLTFFGAGSEPLLKLPAEFMPGNIPHGHRMSGYSVFSVPLDRLPAGTKSIQIEAYDDFASPAPVSSQPNAPAPQL